MGRGEAQSWPDRLGAGGPRLMIMMMMMMMMTMMMMMMMTMKEKDEMLRC